MFTPDLMNTPIEEEEPFDYEESVRFENTLDLLDYSPNEPTYILEEGNESSWTRSLRINEALSRVMGISKAEVQEATQALTSLPAARLRSWLPWIAAKEWTAALLLAFLAFRQAWDNACQWWETTYWDSSLVCWHPRKSPQFSLDSSYELVKARIGYPANQIIDDAWYEDWEKHAAWTCGFTSFAEFARFRAVEGDKWCESLREIRLDLAQPAPCDEGYATETDNTWSPRRKNEHRISAKEMLYDDSWAEGAALAALLIEGRGIREEDLE